ncbi:hypothetical protein [Ruminococcus albus]|uniref:Uncharacterized protein n=1 Tax=Ruminococcus albus TaxID=1264 RepID=A0A1I1CUQ5_RUMAL|nr:hypothetical protein [Ruminococcus albus]SFB66459.1 hypothetical protein SAMN02910406_00076 [Ruminococcus albus]
MLEIKIGEQGALFEICVNGQIQKITLDMLHPIWRDIKDNGIEDIEYLSADICGDLVACCACVSQGQGGIVFVWDTVTESIVHYSDGCYAVRALVCDDMVYTIREVHGYGIRARLELDHCPFGTKDTEFECENCEIDDHICFAEDKRDYFIDFDENGKAFLVKKDD